MLRRMTDAHDARVRQQFGLQAATFDDHGFAVRGLGWIVEELPLERTDLVLDVAAGAMHVARAVAPYVAHVCAIDLTREMLEVGARLATESGLRNISASVGNATALPWLEGQFDVVVCRLALHQVSDPAAVVAEMVRVTRVGGIVAVVDMVVDPDPDVAADTNRLERLRDPSHNRTLGEPEIGRLITAAGARIRHRAITEQSLDLDDWLDRTQTPGWSRREVIERFEAELGGGPPTGLRPSRGDDGGWSFVHTWLMLTAIRDGAAQI
jgi:SAM-dependent methyltransferase